MPCYIRIADRIKRKQRIDLRLPDDESFQAWFERILLSQFRVSNHRLLAKVLDKAYKENPYDLAVKLSHLVSKWSTADETQREQTLPESSKKRRKRRISSQQTV